MKSIGFQTKHSGSALGSWLSKNARKVFKMDSTRFSNARFSKTCDFFLQGGNLMLSFCIGKIQKNTLILFPASGFWWIRNSTNCLKFCNTSSFKLLLLPLYLLHFFQSVNRKQFSWGGLFVSKFHEICFLPWSWNPDWPRLAEVL